MATTQDHTEHVEQLLLPGQAAAPPGSVDLVGMYVMHHAFRRDLQAFTDATVRTPVDDRATWQALEERWERFATVLHHHHTGEDLHLWPLLLARVDAADDRAGRATLEAMEAEHSGIDPLLAACTAGFARLADHADDDARAALAVRMAATRERLAAHLAHEETDAMALVQAHLSVADWDALDEKFATDYSMRDKLFALPWVLHELPADARRRLLGGHPMHVLWRILRPGFERRERAAFRYARH